MEWFYILNEQRFGPVDDAEIRQLFCDGHLKPSDLVWNPAMGDQWQPAEAVPGLIPPPSAPAPSQHPIRRTRPTPNFLLMRRARESLKGQWALAIGVCLLFGILVNGIGFTSEIGPAPWRLFANTANWIIVFFLSAPLNFGLYRVFLQIIRSAPTDANQLFSGFRYFWKTVGTYWLYMLILFLWTLLLLVPILLAGASLALRERAPDAMMLVIPLLIMLTGLSVVPLIRALLAYSQIYFVLSDDPDCSPLECLRRSKQMMVGFKWKYFCLGLRFIGWVLLGILTCGIGLLWVMPYAMAAYAHFYEDIRM